MPGFDGTGPRGQGSMTGGGRGYCVMPLNSRDGYWARGFGRGLGRGFGRGLARHIRGYNNPYYAGSYTPKQEAELLRSEAKLMQEDLEVLNQRIKELDPSCE